VADDDPAHTAVRPMSSADLESVLKWRNHPKVRKHMYTKHEITLDEHTRWFERSINDPSRHLLIYEREGLPLGFSSLQEVHNGHTAIWGFYLSPDAPRGNGHLLGELTLTFAFSHLGLHKVCSEVLAHNVKSLSFHQSLGFRREGLLIEHHHDESQYCDVVCFGLLANEWALTLVKGND
jgi:UDP-4-amino-4,6-dideoxy-N-acetyl-beta-L-altrosamine N-acetyltransferase